MARRIALVALVALGLFVFIAGALASDEIAGAGGYYIADDGLWSETNNLNGLQRTATDADGNPDNGAEVPADTKIAP